MRGEKILEGKNVACKKQVHSLSLSRTSIALGWWASRRSRALRDPLAVGVVRLDLSRERRLFLGCVSLSSTRVV